MTDRIVLIVASGLFGFLSGTFLLLVTNHLKGFQLP